MSAQFESYARTAIGRQLIAAIAPETRDREFKLLSRPSISKAAVYAIADEVRPIIEQLSSDGERKSANQFVGWVVGQRMRALGYRIVNERGRVKNATFKTGAVWAPSESPALDD